MTMESVESYGKRTKLGLLSDEMTVEEPPSDIPPLEVTECIMLYLTSDGVPKSIVVGESCIEYDRTNNISKEWKNRMAVEPCLAQVPDGGACATEAVGIKTNKEKFTKLESRKEHKKCVVETLPKRKLYRCTKCNYRSAYTTNLSEHLKQVHNVATRSSPSSAPNNTENGQNNRGSVNKNSLGIGKEMFTRSRSLGTKGRCPDLRCPFCAQLFTHNKALKLHMECQHLDASQHYVCPHCTKRIAKTDWPSHFRSHAPPAKVSCDKCNKEFKSVFNLRSHNKEVHKEGVSYECPICHKSFSRNDSLRDHINLHKGIICHLCEYCGHGYSRKRSLATHIKAFHPEKLGTPRPSSC